MENLKKKISYSIIRYSPDEIKNEIINIGLLFHNITNKTVKYFILDEKATKLKAITENSTEINLYKSYKEMFEFYLEKCKDDLSGIVGAIRIGSYFEDDLLEKIKEYYDNKHMFLSTPNIAYTKNEDALFKTILERYIGKRNIEFNKTVTMTAKRYMKNLIDSNDRLKIRVKSDKIINPIKDLNEIKVKIDFSFKNGVWNYMQAIPNNTNDSKNLEWFSKIELMLKSEEIQKSKIHLLYKNSDFLEDRATYNLIQYLKANNDNIDIHDIEEKEQMDDLCKYIETKGQILEEVG